MRRFNFYFFLIVFILIGSLLRAQERPVSSGGEARGSGGSLSFSIGQIDYINLNSSTVKITQGVQQPVEILIYPGNKPIIIDIDPQYTLFPNPTRDFTVLHIKQPITQNMSYVLYDMLGRVISRERLVDVKTTIRMDKLPIAVYVLSVVEESTNKILTQFKIVKIL